LLSSFTFIYRNNIANIFQHPDCLDNLSVS